MWTAPLWDSTDVACRRMESDYGKRTDMTLNLHRNRVKGLFGRLLPDIAAVIFHEYPKERQLELIRGMLCQRA